MYSVSANNIVAFTALLPANTTKCSLQLTNLAQSVQLSVDLPASYNKAVESAKYSYDWFLDPNDYDEDETRPKTDTTDATATPDPVTAPPTSHPTVPKSKTQNPQKKGKKDVIPAHILAANHKKATENPFVRGIAWNPAADFLAITLNSYIVLFYEFSATPTEFQLTLHTVIGLPRHLGFITTTPNGKNWLISDTIGDIYGLPHSQILQHSQANQPSLLFSVGAYCTQLFTTTVDCCRSDRIGKKDLLVASDVEGKIRVSNLPNFFDIQSYCMGSTCVPTAQCIINNAKISAEAPSRLLFTSTPKGNIRESVSNPYSNWKPYDPLQTSFTVHNPIDAELVIQPTSIAHAEALFSSIKRTPQTTTTHIGAAPIYNKSTNNTTVYLSPALMTCGLDHVGFLNPSLPITHRTSLPSLIAITIDPVQKTHKVTTTVPLTDIPATFDPSRDLINSVSSSPDQSQVYINTVTNKLIIAEATQNADDQPGLTIKTIFNFGEINDFAEFSPPAKTVSSVDAKDLYNLIHYSVAKYLNFHWRFERAPTKEAAQKRQHLVSLADNDEEGNELVQLGKSSPIKQ